jgi:hypothetical protein
MRKVDEQTGRGAPLARKEQARPHTIGFDVTGRVRNTSVPLQHAFLPLFEAVVNSIHATEERFGAAVATEGKIEVRVHRGPQRQLPDLGRRPAVEGIQGFTIVDNGRGFTDDNLDSFKTAYSTAKIEQGGKGIGRFTWLVVFQSAVVESVYANAAGQRRRRSFAFRPSRQGIEDFQEGAAEGVEPETRIELRGVHERYREPLRKGPDAIAEKLFEHCFHYFILGRCPRIDLVDEGPEGPVAITVNESLAEVTIHAPEPLQVGSHRLEIRHVRQSYRSGRRHTAHLCAHHRVVTSFPLAKISDLGADPIRERDGDMFVHHVFVSGEALDKAVDSTRTRLDLPDGEPLVEQAGALDLKTLREVLGERVDARLTDSINAEREQNLRRIEHHIRSVQPEYRHLITHVPEQLQRVKWSENPQQLDETLYRIQQSWDAEVRRRQAAVEEKLDQDDADPDRLAEELYRVVAEVNETGQANLVRYVAKRRAILKLIQRLMARGAAREEHVHQIVFPMRKNADELRYDDHNLWLVDDTLSFYEFIASDTPFAQNQAAPVDSRRRPDILAFKTGDSYHHVALVEFKRPERKDENPVQQLVEYAVLLREGGARDVHGRTLPGIPRSVRIDAYAVVTLTAEMEKLIRVGPGNMAKVEGDWRWYGGVPNENLSIEVMDYHTFVRRAEQRNRAFFTKLGLS